MTFDIIVYENKTILIDPNAISIDLYQPYKNSLKEALFIFAGRKYGFVLPVSMCFSPTASDKDYFKGGLRNHLKDREEIRIVLSHLQFHNYSAYKKLRLLIKDSFKSHYLYEKYFLYPYEFCDDSTKILDVKEIKYVGSDY